MEPTRIEFMHLPGWQQTLFYGLIFLSLAAMAWGLGRRVRLWQKGVPVDWKSDWLGNIGRFVFGQRKVQGSRPRSGAPMHLAIFYGFMALALATTLLAVNTYSPIKFHQGTYYLVYEAVFDALGLLLVVGTGWALGRRFLARPKSMAHDRSDWITLLFLFSLGVTGYLLEAARIANSLKPWDHWSFVGHALSPALGSLSNGAYLGIWWFHAFLVFGFLAWLPHARIKHVAYAFVSAAGSPDLGSGQLRLVPMEKVEQTGQVGVRHAKEFSRWHLASLDACMECGRCTDACPAHRAGKVLNPKQVVQDVRAALATDEPLAPKVSEEALWACTTCQACVEACPVLIRHVDLIVDVRRDLVAEGQLSGSGATMLRQVGSTRNAWGAPAASREDWMKGQNVPLARDKKEFDVLLWVGCAGATDPAAQKNTRALARLLTKAGVDFACLGREEQCTGDAARRTGDEFLYQELAQGNIQTFGQYKFRRIVSACPHCVHTIGKEYPELGGQYAVQHHTQALAELVEDGKLAPIDPKHTTLHDPCYLARGMGESDAPRALFGEPAGLNGDSAPLTRWLDQDPAPRNLLEPPNHGRKTLCCGAGGGRMWMDEPPEKRPSDRRMDELVQTGAQTVAAACPFCRIMLDAAPRPEQVRLADVAELLDEANP